MSTDDLKMRVTDRLVGWVVNKPLTDVLLLLILGVLGWLGYFALNVAIPRHLTQIQAGYERAEEHHLGQMKTIIDEHAKRFQMMDESHARDREAFRDAMRSVDVRRPVAEGLGAR